MYLFVSFMSLTPILSISCYRSIGRSHIFKRGVAGWKCGGNAVKRLRFSTSLIGDECPIPPSHYTHPGFFLGFPVEDVHICVETY